MSRINKIDFFTGVFLSYIVTNKVKEPTLFDAVDKDSKVIRFSLKDKDYNIYLKYSTSLDERKNAKKWVISFSEEERVFLQTSFPEANRINLIVLVCTNDKLQGNESLFAVIDTKLALECMKLKPHKIKVKKIKKTLYCYGSGIADINMIKINSNCDKILGFISES